MIGRFMSSMFKKKLSPGTVWNDEAESSEMNIGFAHIMKYEELKRATNNFNEELGKGGFGTVYLGKLRDGQAVAVKKLERNNPKRLEQFFNEVTVLSRVRHKNLVTLYGCTDPSTQELLLVYEFAPNGTIADHLYGELSALPWNVRIQIAAEAADALAYLHARDPPIIHRDVKTSNILLDHNLNAKVADLGICRLVPWDTTHVSTQPQGTMGYRDPEYDRQFRLTDKSDVYSFGVVLMELISGQAAVDVNRGLDDIYLIDMITKKKLEDLVDPKLGYQSNNDCRRMINSVAKLAGECLQTKGSTRPLMADVCTILKRIQNEMQQIRPNECLSLDTEVQRGDGSLNVPPGSERSIPLQSAKHDAYDEISESDYELFLPPDYKEILSGAVCPVEYRSMKDLYLRLCNPILVDDKKMSFSLERSTGRKCYTLSTRQLRIEWGENSEYWKWESRGDSRFPEVAKLLYVYWLDIRGRLDCELLSRRTNYAAYLIFKLANYSGGLSHPRQNASVRVGSHNFEHVVCLKPEGESTPSARPDGWMELELGEFFVGDGDDGEVEMRLWETQTDYRKNGLIIEGIEVRPK